MRLEAHLGYPSRSFISRIPTQTSSDNSPAIVQNQGLYGSCPIWLVAILPYMLWSPFRESSRPIVCTVHLLPTSSADSVPTGFNLRGEATSARWENWRGPRGMTNEKASAVMLHARLKLWYQSLHTRKKPKNQRWGDTKVARNKNPLEVEDRRLLSGVYGVLRYLASHKRN